MLHIHRTGGKVTGLTRWPNGSAEFRPDDDAEVVAFRNPPSRCWMMSMTRPFKNEGC